MMNHTQSTFTGYILITLSGQLIDMQKAPENLMQVSGALLIYQSLLFCFVQVDAFVAQCHGHQTNIVRILLVVQRLLHQFQVTVNSFTNFFFVICLWCVCTSHFLFKVVADVSNFFMLVRWKIQIFSQLLLVDWTIPFLCIAILYTFCKHRNWKYQCGC